MTKWTSFWAHVKVPQELLHRKADALVAWPQRLHEPLDLRDASDSRVPAAAERGFVTLAFDPSFTGESGGEVRDVASPDIPGEACKGSRGCGRN